MDFFRRKADGQPKMAPDKQEDMGPWTKQRKIGALVAGAILLMVAAKTCGGSNRKEHQVSQEQKRTEELQRELGDRNAQIQALRNQPEPQVQPTQPTDLRFDPSGLTPAQQQALIASAYGTQQPHGNGTQGYGPSGGYGPAKQSQSSGDQPTAQEKRIDWVSYRSQQAVLDPNRAVQQPKMPELTDVSAVERKPMEPQASQHNADSEQKDDSAVPEELQQSDGPKYLVRKGTLIPCTEQLRINGAFAGNINCLVSVPVYSRSGVHLLIPQYSLLLGRVTKVESTNQERLFVSFEEIIMPDGYTVRMEPQDGLSASGETGLRDKVDRHTARIYGTTLAIAAIAGLAQIGAYGSSAGGYYNPSPMDQYRSGITQSMSNSSMQILQSRLDQKPTFVIQEGARNNVILDQDLKIPDVKHHQMPEDM